MKLDLLSDNTGKLFWRYLFSTIPGSVIISLNFLVDTICVGQSVGEMGLASLNVAVPVTGLLYALGYLFGYGGANRYSGCLGEGDEPRARRIYGAALVSCTLTGVLISVCGLTFLEPLATFLGAVGSYRQGTIDYLRYVFVLAPFFLYSTFFIAFLNNDKAPRLSTIANITGTLLNVVLDVVLITLLGWGLPGASVANGAGLVVTSVILFCATFRKSSGLHLWRCRPDFRELGGILRVGSSSCLREVAGALIVLVINMILVALPGAGETAVAAYGVVANFGTIILNTLNGVSQTMQPLISINDGAGKNHRVRAFLRTGVLTAIGVMGVYVLIGELWPDLLIRIFVDSTDPSFLAMSRLGIRIVFPCYLATGVTVALNVYFEAVQATSEAFWLSLLRGIFAPVLSVFVCAFFWGTQGVWISFLVSECLCMLVALLISRRVRARIAAWNLDQLNFYDSDGVDDSIEDVFRRIGADELSSFKERILRCREENPEEIGVPLYLGLEDFGLWDKDPCESPEADPSMGLLLAVGTAIYANLYEQEEDADAADEAPIERAVRALASHCFLSLPPEAEGDEPELKTHPALIRLYADAAQAEPEQAQEEAQHE